MRECSDTICRLCLSHEGLMMSVFQDRGLHNTVSLRFKIFISTDVEIFADDGLPSSICHNCLHQVEKSYKFRSSAERSDIVLRSKLHTNTTRNDEINHFSFEDASQSYIKFVGAEDINGWSNESSSNTAKIDDSCVPNLSYNCISCSSHFDDYNSYMDHYKIDHSTVNIHICSHCSFCAPTRLEIKKHEEDNHALKYFPCKICERVFRNISNYSEHQEFHEKKKTCCKYCKQSFSSIKSLRQHEHCHIEKICKFCFKEFDSKSEHDKHIETCKSSHSCNFCYKEFEFRKDLMQHVLENHENPTIHKCDTCEQVFFQWVELQNHRCQAKNSYKCTNCGLILENSSQLKAHMNKHKPLKCKFCAKKFGLKSSLKRHEKCHSGLKPYQCKFCPKRFKDNSTCIVHIRTHTGETPFKCNECNKNFRQLANLKMHIFRHHKKNKANKDIGKLNSCNEKQNSPDSSHILKDSQNEINELKQFDTNDDLNATQDDINLYRRVMGSDYELEVTNRVYHPIQLDVPEHFDDSLNNR